jgi:two-component system sensor histidine kinase ChvG
MDLCKKNIYRFYSDRLASDFGNHSGLGLAISKQIVDAHCGLIWAENVRAPDAEDSAPSDGARFVVGLPV